MHISPIKRISGWLPVAMSLAALTVLLGHAFFFGVAREPDEGATAHVFQLLMAAQAPVIGLFAFKELSRAPMEALPVLALQIAAALAALAPVYLLGL